MYGKAPLNSWKITEGKKTDINHTNVFIGQSPKVIEIKAKIRQ